MFELAFPWAFLALPIPVVIWFLLPRVPLELPAALKVPFFDGIAAIFEKPNSSNAQQVNRIWLFLIWALLLIALSGPRWVGAPMPLEREGRNIMMALDLSGSMELNDLLWKGRPATRLSIVKRAAMQFVNDRKTDKIGLILFGSQAYLQTPLTYDHRSVLMRIDDATVGLAGKTTSIGDALGLAVKRLQSVPSDGRVIILLTDGVNNSGVLDPIKAAELAASEGIKIYTIGLGANPSQQQENALFLALNPAAELDEDTLKEVAEVGGGQYFRATDGESLHKVYKTINQLEMASQESETIRPQFDYYAWPLSIALLILIIFFIRQRGHWPRILTMRSSAQDEYVL